MPTALSDPSTTLYAILAVMAGIQFAVWYFHSRRRGDLVRAVAFLVVLLGLFLIDRFVESPREQATRKMQEMAQATEAKNWDAFAEHLSASFAYKSANGETIDKPRLLNILKTVNVLVPDFKGVTVWDFHRADFKPVDERNVQMGFRAQVRDMPATQSWIIADFTLDPDGQWRVAGFGRYDFAKQDRSPKQTIPGLD